MGARRATGYQVPGAASCSEMFILAVEWKEPLEIFERADLGFKSTSVVAIYGDGFVGTRRCQGHLLKAIAAI